jgi:Tfp pilus assembly protein FimT
MNRKSYRPQGGFSVLETVVVVTLVGTLIAVSVPIISLSMREYRLNTAMRQMVDTIKRIKMQAVSENRRAAMMIDTAGLRAGIATLNDDGTVNRIDYIPLPSGIRFDRPEGDTAPPGVVSSGVVSFPSYEGSTTLYKQDFNSRGFPAVANGADVVSIFISNGESFRSIVMNSVGGIRTYTMESDARDWSDTRK